MCLKLKHPGSITLLRGNHESRTVTQAYGFYDEIIRKYGNLNPWKYCCEVFDYLGVGAEIEGKIFCIHGGLSPDIKTLDQIRIFERRQEIPHEGAFADLMWSDPDDIETWSVNPRGAGWNFGSKVVSEFCHINGLELIARAHQLVMEGYKFWFRDQNVVTVWSAVNYCYRCGNDASIMQVGEDLQRNFLLFKPSKEK